MEPAPGAKGPQFEDVCRYVGRLYLESQYEIDRLAAAASTPSLQALREQLMAEQRKNAELGQRVAHLEERLREPAA